MGVRQTKNKKGNKISTILGTIICLILLPILIINITLIIKSYTNKYEVPSVGNAVPMIVLTDSMYPIIESGDLIILNKIDANSVQVNDIITFFDPDGNGDSTVTHRVVEIIEENGEINFKTKGDANNAEDKSLVSSDKIIGIYSFKISGLGNIAMFMSTTKGLIICVIVPLILLVGFDLITRKAYEKKNENDKEALMKELERLRAEKNQSTKN